MLMRLGLIPWGSPFFVSGGSCPATDKDGRMRLLLLVTWLALCSVAPAKPLFDQYGFFAVQAPDDWVPSRDPLGLKLPGSVWMSSKDRKSVRGVATMPANSDEEKKVAVEMIGTAISEQLTRKGFRCTVAPTTVAGQPGEALQGVNKLNQRVAAVVTRRDSVVAIFFYVVDSSVKTDAYTANLKGMVDGFEWAKAKPAGK